jgi:L-alanine-DL-glutamate epimerase-like enolase superfamily enzyme
LAFISLSLVSRRSARSRSLTAIASIDFRSVKDASLTGEHVYTRYGFRQLLRTNGAEIWQPDIHWCGGMTELRRIGALAAAYDIPVIPHGGGSRDSVHYIMATPNSPWAEMFMPAPGGPAVVYERYEQDNNLTRGPEGIYTRPSDEPGFGWDVEVA